MSDDKKLSVDNMVEMAMGLSVASLFANAMNATFNNTVRMLDNNQVAAPPRYIYAIMGGQQHGPYSLGEVFSMIKSGDITPKTYIWKPGMGDWKVAAEVEDLAPGMETTPPQVPQNEEV